MPDSTVRETELSAAAANAAAESTRAVPVAGPQTRADPGHLSAVKDQALAVVKQTRFKWLERVRAFVRHPLTQLIVAIILIVTSLIEASETFVADFWNAKLRASHGLLIVGIVQVMAAIPDLIEGLERYIETAAEHQHEHKSPPQPDEPAAPVS